MTETVAWLLPILHRLRAADKLSKDDLNAFKQAPWERISVAARQTTDHLDGFTVLVSGAVFRSLPASNDLSHPLALLLPGDVCSFAFLAAVKDRDILLPLTKCVFAHLTLSGVADLFDRRPPLLMAVLAQMTSAKLMQDELALSLASRDALTGMAHLICEMDYRLSRVHLVVDGSFGWPFFQSVIGQYLGLSTVHTNRVIQMLRREKLIEIVPGTITILDKEKLQALCGFDPWYLTGGDQR